MHRPSQSGYFSRRSTSYQRKRRNMWYSRHRGSGYRYIQEDALMYMIGHHTGGVRRLWAGAALAVVVVGSGSAAATAQPAPEDQRSLEAARQALMGATVESVEVDLSSGAPELEVDMRTRDGAGYEVTVDLNTATVLSVEPDGD
ncbi:PepSY domain-containing protein [Nocardia testacea]|uniref:PepSY domain-containing protein n=1 Tax=Nocardia testacea TaxID=248551 RepID=A0ABW7VTG7_9NOCA